MVSYLNSKTPRIPGLIEMEIRDMLRGILHINHPVYYGNFTDLKSGCLRILSGLYVTGIPTIKEIFEKGFGSYGYRGTMKELKDEIKNKGFVPVKGVSYVTGDDIGIVFLHQPSETDDSEDPLLYSKFKKDFEKRMRRLEIYGEEF